MATVWTAYQGVEVVESDSTVKYRHPRLGADDSRLASLEGASLLALVDGTFLVVCDTKDCGFNGLTGYDAYVKPEGTYKSIVDQAGSLFSHINGKHRKGMVDRKPVVVATPSASTSPHPRYTEAQIKVAIKVWLKWKATGIKHWTQSACDELERLGFKPSFAEKWNPDQLGSLTRQYMKRDKYKNIKAGPMDDADRQAIAEMVREATERAATRGSRTAVAANARITQQGTRQTRVQHTPVDFDRIIKAAQAAKAERQQPEEEEPVPSDTPTLSFAGRDSDYVEPTPTRTLTIDKDAAVSSRSAEPEVTTQVNLTMIPAASDYEHILELEGTPVFRYKGVLMAGKPVKGVEV